MTILLEYWHKPIYISSHLYYIFQMKGNNANNTICLAVLPLQVLADEPRVDVFCQGLVMDLITDLSPFRSFQIIAYDTTKAVHPNEQPDSSKLGELHLDYLVKGMARFLLEKLQINLQLINVPKNRVVWSKKFSGGFDELFQIQEDIVEKIVSSLQQFLDYDLLSEIRKKPLTSLNAYECWLRGYHELKKGTFEADEQARSYFRMAMEIDPHFSRAYTGMSLSYFNEWSCQLWSRWEVSQSGAFEWAQKALELDEKDHVSNAILGRVYLFGGEYDKSEHYLRKSLRINSNDAGTLLQIAVDFTYLGYTDEAKKLIERALRINPADSTFAYAYGSLVYFESGEIDAAISLAEQHQIGNAWVDYPALQAAAHFFKGNYEKMQTWWKAYLIEFSEKINGGKPTDTQTALQWMINVNPYRGESKQRPFWKYMSQTDLNNLIVEKSEVPSAHHNQFTKKGELWTVSFDGKQVQLYDLKGYHDLARLLAEPAQTIHCTDLMGAQVLEKGEEVFDEKAKTTYQKRIRQLQQDIEEAKTLADNQRLEELQEEYDEIMDHVSRAVGKGGKARKVTGTVEKCRTAVTWRIRNALKKIAEVHPNLGTHLEASIKTGIFCEYSPEHKVKWIL